MDRLREFALRRRALVPYEFPFTVPAVMYSGTLVIAGTAAVQRNFTQPWLLLVAGILVFAPIALFVVSGYKVPPWATAALTLAGVALLHLAWPPILLDAAPFLLMFMLGEVFALGSLRDGLLAAAATALLLIGACLAGHLDTPLQYLLFFMAIAAMIGRILQLQQRLVLKERDRQAALTQQAAADERRRIAREVHDVIAHSLSVTMLHLTGARRALQEDHDVDDAVDALRDAEQLGRQAMSDIRRTVGLLGTGPSDEPRDCAPLRLTPEPGWADIPELITSFAAAGLRVDSRIEGTPDLVSAGAGLALFRVTQESLANIAKHAPDSAVRVRLHVIAGAATISVHNELARPMLDVTPGAGLSGMRQRIEMLDGEFAAGPGADGWTVAARIPLGAAPPQNCAIQRNLLRRNKVDHD